MNRRRCVLVAVGVVHLFAAPFAAADVIEIFEDQAAWENALAEQESIFFDDLGGGFIIVTDQYADLGVLFTDGNDFINPCFSCRDDFGLNGMGTPFLIDINLAFDRPRTAVAIDFPGSARFDLFSEGELIYTSSGHLAPPGETAFFGLLSDQPFDAVRSFDTAGDGQFIDNLFFGDVIPAPGAMALFGLASLARSRRRKRR